MARKRSMRIMVDETGHLMIVDPGLDTLSLIREINPDFSIKTSALPGFSGPSFMKCRNTGCGVDLSSLANFSDQSLWLIHAHFVKQNGSGNRQRVEKRNDEASLLDLKIELCWRILKNCTLCARRCRVDRTIGQLGRCGLGMKGLVAEHYIHIAEEPPINPSFLVSLRGCGLGCCFCQQWDLMETSGKCDAEKLDEDLWGKIDFKSARSLSFIGGNPDESLFSVLGFLKGAPETIEVPVVWNTNAFSSPETVALLTGVVDVFVADLKFHDPMCAEELAQASNYPMAARNSIAMMLDSNAVVIVRMLLLPGHLDCCHVPSLRWLAAQNCKNLYISPRGQYHPDYLALKSVGNINRRIADEELEIFHRAVFNLGLEGRCLYSN